MRDKNLSLELFKNIVILNQFLYLFKNGWEEIFIEYKH